MVTIQGIIERYTFHNEETGYSVARLENNITAIGNLPGIKVGQTVRLNGDWVLHPSYGKQFKIESFSASYPATVTGIAKYLGSGLVKGIGPVTAERIVKVFKEQTLEIIENSLERLLEVDGVGLKRLKMIEKGWQEQKSIKDLMLFLQTHDISTTHAIKIYKTYGDESISVVREDPYKMTYDVWGIGFKTSDKIGRNIGFDENHPARIKAGIVYVLNEAVNNGHVFLPSEKLIEECSRILDLEVKPDSPVFQEMESNEHIILKDEKVYLPPFYFAELGITSKINKLLSKGNTSIKKNQLELNPNTNKFFSPEQLEAINTSLHQKMLILTGGPGTGKTTTLKGIIKIHQMNNKRILLAAPTGRAAKRMGEVIGLEAKTIHRLLEFDPGLYKFKKDEENQLEADLLVIDEVSMIDTILMNSLLKAVNNKTTVILVGDVNQLPSIGAGNILKDLIESEKIPVVKLTKIFRQAEKSRIVVNAHRINRGEFPEISNKTNSDFFFIEEKQTEKIPDIIQQLCEKRLPARYGFNPIRDIQILTPMYRGDAGANNLNKIIQETVNKSPVIFSRAGRQYKIGDKVMQLRNNYDKEVFNGDIGFIQYINQETQVMKINFNNISVSYDFADLDEILLAYAVTVHKSQGSEYPCVILPLTLSHYMMLQRNLIYTAITRASKLMIIVGTKKALSIALHNNKVQERYTSLLKD